MYTNAKTSTNVSKQHSTLNAHPHSRMHMRAPDHIPCHNLCCCSNHAKSTVLLSGQRQCDTTMHLLPPPAHGRDCLCLAPPAQGRPPLVCLAPPAQGRHPLVLLCTTCPGQASICFGWLAELTITAHRMCPMGRHSAVARQKCMPIELV